MRDGRHRQLQRVFEPARTFQPLSRRPQHRQIARHFRQHRYPHLQGAIQITKAVQQFRLLGAQSRTLRAARHLSVCFQNAFQLRAVAALAQEGGARRARSDDDNSTGNSSMARPRAAAARRGSPSAFSASAQRSARRTRARGRRSSSKARRNSLRAVDLRFPERPMELVGRTLAGPARAPHSRADHCPGKTGRPAAPGSNATARDLFAIAVDGRGTRLARDQPAPTARSTAPSRGQVRLPHPRRPVHQCRQRRIVHGGGLPGFRPPFRQRARQQQATAGGHPSSPVRPRAGSIVPPPGDRPPPACRFFAEAARSDRFVLRQGGKSLLDHIGGWRWFRHRRAPAARRHRHIRREPTAKRVRANQAGTVPPPRQPGLPLRRRSSGAATWGRRAAISALSASRSSGWQARAGGSHGEQHRGGRRSIRGRLPQLADGRLSLAHRRQKVDQSQAQSRPRWFVGGHGQRASKVSDPSPSHGGGAGGAQRTFPFQHARSVSPSRGGSAGSKETGDEQTRHSQQSQRQSQSRHQRPAQTGRPGRAQRSDNTPGSRAPTQRGHRHGQQHPSPHRYRPSSTTFQFFASPGSPSDPRR